MHLHGHIKDCILDFGPVYSFWLFSFKRLNGPHHITRIAIPEYRDDLSSLIFYHDYQKGSLQATTLEQVLEQYQSHKINPLPPVHEAAWELHQKPGLHYLVKALVGHDNYTLLTLYNKASSLSIGGYILGSTSSRFVTKSHVIAIHPKYPNELHLAKIEYFAKLDARDNTTHASLLLTVMVDLAYGLLVLVFITCMTVKYGLVVQHKSGVDLLLLIIITSLFRPLKVELHIVKLSLILEGL